MRKSIEVLTLLVMVMVIVAGCTSNPSEEEIREAVLVVSHAVGAVRTRSLSAKWDQFEGADYNREDSVIRFDGLDLAEFELEADYSSLSGTVDVAFGDITNADTSLQGGAVSEVEFAYLPSDPLAAEWTVAGSADGRRFEIVITGDQVRAFRQRAPNIQRTERSRGGNE